jgi:hypothetical protein
VDFSSSIYEYKFSHEYNILLNQNHAIIVYKVTESTDPLVLPFSLF